MLKFPFLDGTPTGTVPVTAEFPESDTVTATVTVAQAELRADCLQMRSSSRSSCAVSQGHDSDHGYPHLPLVGPDVHCGTRSATA